MKLSNSEKLLRESFGIPVEVIQFVQQKETQVQDVFAHHQEIRAYNQLKVIQAFQEQHLSATDFYSPTGYGYGDQGRDKVDEVFASVFRTEDALVRSSIASGTHALTLCLQGVLLPGDEMLCITDTPYDTMQKIIGLKGALPHTLKEWGIRYRQLNLKDEAIDLESIEDALTPDTKMVYLQRSTGYSDRSAIPIDEMRDAIAIVKRVRPDMIVMVDNCYGEFTEIIEPSEIGADLIAGSLIKNPGGGIARSGGYVAGKRELVERIAYRLTAPGLGRDVGLSYGTTREVLQGLYFAPHITCEAMQVAILFAAVYDAIGYTVRPSTSQTRSDIVQTIQLGTPDEICRFCEAVQSAGSIDAHVTPIPWDMPGYSDQIIMASSGFVEGSSIEVSADGPLRPPYNVFYQGGLTYDQGKLAVMKSVAALFANHHLQWDGERFVKSA